MNKVHVYGVCTNFYGPKPYIDKLREGIEDTEFDFHGWGLPA